MAIVAKKSGEVYETAPAGSHSAVCVDVVDLGILSVTYAGKTKEQHKIEVIWQIDETRKDGKRFTVRQRYTLSLHEKAALRKTLEGWRGKPFTEVETQGFDLETLLGVACMVNVIHNVNGENTYANVSAVMKLPRGMVALKQLDYVRVITRDPAAPGHTQAQPFGEITDDDIPF